MFKRSIHDNTYFKYTNNRVYYYCTIKLKLYYFNPVIRLWERSPIDSRYMDDKLCEYLTPLDIILKYNVPPMNKRNLKHEKSN